jgi:tetratricopeptide (TPR) repeat protein
MNQLKRYSTLAFWILCSLTTEGQVFDSLVRWNELIFSTSFEQASFTGFLKENRKDFARMFMANSSTADQDIKFFEEKFNITLNEIISSDAMKKKNDKKIKYIYQAVHDRFLSKYEAENRFYEIMKTGNYNCVTATALYALFFEKLNIPYAIKEEPTHVYLVAYPNAENILIETTTPLSGFFSFETEFKSKFVSTLKNQKIIGGSEAQSSNMDELFNKYYFGNENITLTQLIGIHYLNDGLFLRDHEDFAGAYEQVKKGYIYYPNARSEFLLASFTAVRLEQGNLEPLKKSTLIGIISRFKNAGITTDMIKGEFYNLTQTVLSKNNDKVLYKKCYDEIINNTSDDELKKEISYIYNHENGRVFYNQGNYIQAKAYFASALEIQPNNVDLGGLFVSSLGQSFRNERNNKVIVDSLESYKVRFASLEQNNNFNSMIALVYAVEFGDNFEKGNIARGEKYLQMFEAMYETNKSISLLSPGAVGKAYSEACVYFFKKGQKGKAKQLLDKGLQIVPDDFQLKMRKQMINGG